MEKNVLFFAPGNFGEGKVLEILRKEQYQVVAAESLQEFVQAFSRDVFDLVIFGQIQGDINITDISVTIRSMCRVPVLFLLPEGTDPEYFKKVKSCADDFLIWPVREEELLLRTDLVLSCHAAREKKHSKDSFSVGKMSFDFKNQVIHTPGGPVNLTRIESQLLQLLCLYRNNILPRELALETIWGERDYFKARSMDVYVAKLRKLFSHDDSVKITNIHNVGFRLDVNEGSHGKKNPGDR